MTDPLEQQTPAPEDEAAFTVLFHGDIRKFGPNPFVTDTPFGRPVCIGVGNVFAERDRLDEALAQTGAR